MDLEENLKELRDNKDILVDFGQGGRNLIVAASDASSKRWGGGHLRWQHEPRRLRQQVPPEGNSC